MKQSFLGSIVLFGGVVVALSGATAQISPPIDRRPIIYPPIPPRPWPRPALNQELQLITESARVEINGAVAKTHLTQTFLNTTNNRIEGTYVFPLPEGAAVSGFAMMVNGKRTEAEILDGDKAREIYQGIVAKMRDPAIFEFIDRNLIRAKIFPIEPRAEQKIELEYSESLTRRRGQFSLCFAAAFAGRRRGAKCRCGHKNLHATWHSRRVFAHAQHRRETRWRNHARVSAANGAGNIRRNRKM